MTTVIFHLIYGLLISKGSGDYNEFFGKLFEQDNFQSELIMIDFESGTIKPVKEVLPNVLQKGKFYLVDWRKGDKNISLQDVSSTFHKRYGGKFKAKDWRSNTQRMNVFA